MADRRALIDLMNRQARVEVTNPRFPESGWVGRIIAIADDPGIILEREGDELRVPLPQSFGVTELPPGKLDSEDEAQALAVASGALSRAQQHDAARAAHDLMVRVIEKKKLAAALAEVHELQRKWDDLLEWAAGQYGPGSAFVTRMYELHPGPGVPDMPSVQLPPGVDRFLGDPSSGTVRSRPDRLLNDVGERPELYTGQALGRGARRGDGPHPSPFSFPGQNPLPGRYLDTCHSSPLTCIQ